VGFGFDSKKLGWLTRHGLFMFLGGFPGVLPAAWWGTVRRAQGEVARFFRNLQRLRWDERWVEMMGEAKPSPGK
jgi:hypothetical protein